MELRVTPIISMRKKSSILEPNRLGLVGRCRQRGAALLIILGILVLLTSAILLDRLNAAVAPTPSRDPTSVNNLARAKETLIAWAATHPDTPGLLPFPDRNDEGTPDYDGAADCVAAGTVGPAHLLGSFPIRGELALLGCATDVPMSIEIADSSGQRLWYAVSQNLVRGGGGGLVNPDIGELGTHPWIVVRDAGGNVITDPVTLIPLSIAAVIIAPGPALAGQDRSAVAPAAANYLDTFAVGGVTYDNSDADGCSDNACATPGEEFIINTNPQAGSNFNDRLVFITVDELMGAVQDRVLGDAALALKSYRDSQPVAASFYPWLAPFSNPRSPHQGIATGGSPITLDGDGTDFGTPPAVNPGDLVRNLTDGSTGTVAAIGVPSTSLDLDGLLGGATNAFASGDRYVVHSNAKFKGVAGTVDGLLPLHFPNEIFQTGFTVEWNFDEQTFTYGGDPNPILMPDENTAEKYDYAPLTIDYPNGLCMWTQFDRVACKGTATLPNTPSPGITRTVEVWFNFTSSTPPVIVAPTATSPRTRNHTLDEDTPYTDIGPVPLLTSAGQTWSVRVIHDDGTPTALPCPPPDGPLKNCSWVTAEPDGDTDLWILQFDGIRYEIGVPDELELPRWFVDNNWHHFIYASISDDALPGGNADADADCATPVNTCLTVQFNGTMVRDDVAALVIGPGTTLTAQDRITATTLCSGQSPPKPAIFCDYFEGPNSDDESPSTRNLVFGRTPSDTFSVTTTFNDQIRAVPP
jgi:hypothetical protein